jgi:hypothetical protein
MREPGFWSPRFRKNPLHVLIITDDILYSQFPSNFEADLGSLHVSETGKTASRWILVVDT